MGLKSLSADRMIMHFQFLLLYDDTNGEQRRFSVVASF